ncbi:hypothetical protein [Aquipseudomonas alcaligenes]|uniref:hypothetical protein n=1 Tax=Aquipseudomonas alcaligenes TaxID=43263 RepID=UPI00364AAD32
MIERKTVLDQPELNLQAGVLGVRIAFLLVEGEEEIDSKWHRTAIPVNVDPAHQMALVNAHLAIMEPPMPPVSEADIDFVVQCHTLLTQRLALL